MKLLLTNSRYRIVGEKPVVYLDCRKENGEYLQLEIKGFKPNFFIDDKDSDTKLKLEGFGVDDGYKTFFGRKCKKVEVNIPKEVGRFRKEPEWTGEANVKYPYRFLLDNELTGFLEYEDGELKSTEFVDVDPRICCFDIEIDNYEGNPDTSRATKKVIAISAYDNYDNECTVWHLKYEDEVEGAYSFSDEKEMLEDFFKWIDKKNPDLFSGYNVRRFDLIYLVNRAKVLGCDFSKLSRTRKCFTNDRGEIFIGGRDILDIYETYKESIHGGKRKEPRNYKLDTVLQRELGKEKYKFDAPTVGHLWRKNESEMVYYNRRDALDTWELADHMGTVQLYKQLCAEQGINYSDAGSKLRVIDNAILRKLYDDDKEKRLIAPTPQPKEKGKTRAGAKVMKPEKGVFENVVYLDFNSLYPSLVKTLNVSPETKVECSDDNCDHLRASNGVCFEKNEVGLISGIVDDWLEDKDELSVKKEGVEYKSDKWYVYDTMRDVTKIQLNAVIGVLRNPYFRFMDVDCYEAVTISGQDVLQFMIDSIKGMGYVPIIADTDGIGFSIPGKLKDCDDVAEKIIEDIDFDKFAKEQFNADEHRFIVELDDIYSSMLVAGVKKRYAGWKVYDDDWIEPEFSVTGFDDIVKSDRANLSGKVQTEIVKMVLAGKGLSDLHRYIDEVKSYIQDNINNREFLNEIGFPKGINKHFHEYKRPTKVVKGAEYMNERFGTDFGKGDKPMWLPVKFIGGNDVRDSPSDGVIAFYEDTKLSGVVVDVDEVMRKILKDSTEKVLPATNFNWNEVSTGKEQTGLEQYI